LFLVIKGINRLKKQEPVPPRGAVAGSAVAHRNPRRAEGAVSQANDGASGIGVERFVTRVAHDLVMGFNRRKLEADRKAKADAEAAARRATDAQVPNA
jgi:hypothetical protein